MKKLLTNKKIYIVTLIISIVTVFVAVLWNGSKTNDDDPKFNLSNGYYEPMQYEIGSGTAPTASDYTIVSMTDAYNQGSVVENTRISISTAEELYLFSEISNSNASFLGYYYILLNDIDYSETSNPFVPVGWKGTGFSGTFDGRGYEISNLKFVPITSDNATTYASMVYFSMFSSVSNDGKVCNLGLINSNIVLSVLLNNMSGISPLVGENYGTVEYVYVKNLQDPYEENGITANGGYRISGLMCDNYGVFTNSYVAYSIVVNYTVTDYISFTEILDNNYNGSYSKLYVYNSSVSLYILESNIETVTYDIGLIGKTYTRNNYSKFVYDLADLCVNNKDNEDILDSGWYNNNSYNESIRAYFAIETPVLNGLSYDDNTKSFIINNEDDFGYMFTLMNMNSYFASDDVTYRINSDLNLSNIPASVFKYTGTISATFEGVEGLYSNTVFDVTGGKSDYPTIYNAPITNYVITEGIECYGIFPWLSGTVRNLNFYNNTEINSISSTSNNIKAIGIVSGYVEGGTIDNVNVLSNINLFKSIKKYYAGGIVGILGGNGCISNCTTTGTISDGNGHTTFSENESDGCIEGNSIGGVVGYISNTMGDVTTCLSAINITAKLFTSSSNVSVSIGGVIGSGYTKNVSELTNKGNIIVGNGNNSNYGSLFVGGVIGRHIGVSSQVSLMHNQGNITVYANANETKISGVCNVDLITQATDHLTTSSFKDNSSRFIYYGNSYTNAANINVLSPGSDIVVSGIITLASNSTTGYITNLSGLYNLEYQYTNTGGTQAISDNQSFTMNYVDIYAGCIYTEGNSSSFLVNASYIYNFRDVSFNTAANVDNDLLYAGCIVGKYVDLSDVRNEGNIMLSASNAIAGNIKVMGVFEELSLGCTADIIYNAGDVELDYSETITGNVYLSGICYEVNNSLTETELLEYNPLSSTFNNDKKGTINNVINNGDISCTSGTYEDAEYTGTNFTGINGQQTIGTRYTVTLSVEEAIVDGNINCSGITYLNESVITNTFNLGDVFAANYINRNATTEINAAGISTLNVGRYAYIENSANNGSIKAMNLSSSEYSNVNAAGITVRNDKTATGGDYSGGNGHAEQMIAFTINYGSVYSYNYCDNIESSAQEASSKSAGILAMGLCNIINTVNYGNIYGSETASGIFGIVYFQKFTSDVNVDNKINLANSINYGNVWCIEKGYNHFTDASLTNQTYNEFVDMTDENKDEYAKVKVEVEYVSRNTFIGSVFAIVNFNSDMNANNVSIRYLISFLENVNLVGAEASTPSSISIDVSNMYSAFYEFTNGLDVYDTYMGQTVVYSPLSTTEVNGYDGVFSEEFAFRKAIEGEAATSSVVTDKFLSDYFQFVAYQKINDHLLDKIGWRTIAYYTAANDFAQNLESVSLLLTYYNKEVSSQNYSSLVNDALDTNAWMIYSSDSVILELTTALLEANDYEASLGMLEFLLSEDCESSILITNTLRVEILEAVFNYAEENNYSDFSLINLMERIITYNNGFSALLADSILSGNDNESVTAYLSEYINNNLSITQQKEIFDTYIAYLEDNENDYFAYKNSEEVRKNLLSDLFASIDDELFYSQLIELLEITDTAYSDIILMNLGYQELTDQEKIEMFAQVISNNTVDEISTYLSSMSSDIQFYEGLIDASYSVSTMDEIYKLIGVSNTDYNANVTNEVTISERIDLYNRIKDTETFNTYINQRITGEYIALATEHRNTYQSVTPPSNSGAYSGDLSYAYTKDVTPSTYFYGPYNDKAKNTREIASNTNLSDVNAADEYYSIFASTDKAYMDELVAAGMLNTYYTFYYEYGGTGTNNQLCQDNYFNRLTESADVWKSNTTDFSGTRLNYDNNYLFYPNGNKYPISYGVVSAASKTSSSRNGTTAVTFTITDANGNGHAVSGNGYYVADENGNNRVNISATINGYVSFVRTFGLAQYIAVPTVNYHSTRITGIHKYAEIWDEESFYFTWKGSSTRVYTSQYIDYTVEDLLELDGYLTNYSDGSYESADERNIINDLFNTYFYTDKTNFQKVIQKALLENLGSDVNYVDTFVNGNLYSDVKINNTEPINYLDYSVSQTLGDYIKSNANVDMDSKEMLIAGAIKNQDKFIALLDKISAMNKALDADVLSNYLEYESIIKFILNNSSSLSNDEILLSSLSNLTNSELSNLLDPFDDGSDVVINSTGNLLSTITNDTYESINYNYALNFKSLSLNLNQYDKKLVFIAKSNTGGTTTLSVNGTNYSITSAMNEYTIEIPSTNVVLAANNDVNIYSMYTVRETPQEGGVFRVNDPNNSASIALYDDTDFKDAIIDNIGFDNVTNIIYTVRFEATVANSSDDTVYYQRIQNLTNAPVRATVGVNLTASVVLDQLSTVDYGKTITVYAINYDAEPTATNSYVTISNVNYEIKYTYDLVTNEDIYTQDLLYKNRLLSLDLPTFTKIRECYIEAIFNDVNDNTFNEFIFDSIMYFIPIEQGANLKNTLDNIYVMSDTDKEELIKIIITITNDNLHSFLEDVSSSDSNVNILNIALSYLLNYDYRFLSEAITNSSDSLADDYKTLLTAGYIVTDYSNSMNQQINVYDTVLNTNILINLNSELRYINSDGTFNNDYFENLCSEIGYSLATTGYGIYALSSSEGILNGQFIPDNLILDDFKAGYVDAGDYWLLSKTNSEAWRGSSETEGTVSYAISVEMKQLKKSISTTIFTLDLLVQDGSGIVLYSSESTIDLENGIITYYIPKNYITNPLGVKIDNESISIANAATMYLSGSKDLSSIFNVIVGYNDNFILVEAEDTSITKDYIINIVEMDVDFNLAVNTSLSTNLTVNNGEYHVPYVDGVIAIDVTSNTLPSGLDLTPYISIKSNGEIVNNVFTLESNPIIDENGDTTIYMEILNKLPYGEYEISVKLFSVEKTITFIKNQSTECNIEEMQFEGEDVVFDDYSATSYIPFGRAYSYDELYSLSYLNQFEISLGATYDVNVIKEEDENTGLMTYVVTIVVTAENNNSNEYVHSLVETNPYSITDGNPVIFATIYKNGSIDLTAYYDGENNINSNFTRGEEPTYRVKYNLNKFYTIGNNVEYLATEVAYNYVVSSLVYNGLQITVTDDASIGSYTFTYKYRNTSTWENGESYTREYSFGEFTITKEASLDSLLHRINFLDTNKVTGALATVMYPNAVIRPGDDALPSDGISPAEQLYNNLKSEDNEYSLIEVDDKTIDYKYSGVDYTNEKDYFLVGTLANAELSDYAPTFKIEDHAEIYQYTTNFKLLNYGDGLQDNLTDHAVLTNKETMFLYVPYKNDSTVVIYLVELDENNAWSNVYTTAYNGKNGDDTKIATISSEDKSFDYDGKTWTVDSSAGKTQQNTSLYMDYIGTPQSDHFWFVSYVVFSEDYLSNPKDNDNFQCYHVSLIDITNTIYFDVTIDAQGDIKSNLYLTIVTNVYETVNENGEKVDVELQKQISAFAAYDEETKLHYLTHNLQVIQNGYTYFYLDLPDGYVARYTVTNGKINTNVIGNSNYKEEESGAYKPVSTIVTQKISILIEIVEGENGVIWGEATSDAYTRLVTFEGVIDSVNTLSMNTGTEAPAN